MQGENGRALAGTGTGVDNLNLAINLGNGLNTPPGGTGNPTTDPLTNTVSAVGQAHIAVNIFGNSDPGIPRQWNNRGCPRRGGLRYPAIGLGNAAYNLSGDGNQVTVGDQGSNFGLGFSVLGNRNDVVVSGPLAVGGTLFQNDLNGADAVEQFGPVSTLTISYATTTALSSLRAARRTTSGRASASGPAATRRPTSATRHPREGRHSRRSATGLRRRSGISATPSTTSPRNSLRVPKPAIPPTKSDDIRSRLS